MYSKFKTPIIATIFFIILLSFIHGCAFNNPIPDGYNGPLTRIEDSSKFVSATKIHFFQLTRINGRSIKSSSDETTRYNMGRGFEMTPMTIHRYVPSEKSILSIEGKTHVASPILALGGEMFSVKGDVEIDLEPDGLYRIKGELSKNYSVVWVEDVYGKIVSNKITKRVAGPDQSK